MCHAEVGAKADQNRESGGGHATPDIEVAVEWDRDSPHMRKSCEGDDHASPSMSAASHGKSSGSASPGASNGSAAGNAGPLGSQSQHPGSADPKQGEGSTSPASAAHNADALGNSGSGGMPICLVGQPHSAFQRSPSTVWQ